MKKFIIPTLLLGGILLIPRKKKKSLSLSPITYGCDYVKLTGDDDKVRMYLVKLKNEYFILHPSTELEQVNFIELTGFILSKLNKICYDKFINKELSKEQGFLLYSVLSYFTIYNFVYDQFSTGADPISIEELLIAFEEKKQEVQEYLGIDIKDSEEQFKKIILGLEQDREIYIQ